MFNFIDIVLILITLYLVWQGMHTGFVGGVLNLITTVVAFILASLFYSPTGNLIASIFKINVNFASVIGFFVVLLLGEIAFSIILAYLYHHFARFYKNSPLVATLDKYLGIIPSVLVGVFLISLLMLMILTLPVKPWLREPIQDSWWGKNVVVRGVTLMPSVEKLLSKTPYKNLVYLVTPAGPKSKESQDLNIPSNVSLRLDPTSEKEMFDLVNKERNKVGLPSLVFDNALRDVGRAHCTDMFKRSYFSHNTPEGKDPFQRMEEAGIQYLAMGENLAYAPSVAIAHEGLMNSTGHRENILRKSFGKVGVGVIDAGINGKMFCQEFTD